MVSTYHENKMPRKKGYILQDEGDHYNLDNVKMDPVKTKNVKYGTKC